MKFTTYIFINIGYIVKQMFQSGNEEQQKSRDLKFTEWSNDQGSFAQMDRMVAIICFYGTQVKKRLSSSWSNVPDYLANMEQLYNSFLRPIKDAATQKRLDNEFSEIWGIIRGQRGQLVNGNVYDRLNALEKELFGVKQELNMTFKLKPEPIAWDKEIENDFG